METNGRTDGRTKAIALPPSLMLSVTSISTTVILWLENIVMDGSCRLLNVSELTKGMWELKRDDVCVILAPIGSR